VDAPIKPECLFSRCHTLQAIALCWRVAKSLKSLYVQPLRKCHQNLIFEQFTHDFSPLTLGELFLLVVLFVAPYYVGLSTVAVLSDHSRSNLILLELIVPQQVPSFSAETALTLLS
jgi:hypothetical protein